MLKNKRTHTHAQTPLNAPQQPRWYFVNGNAVYGVPAPAEAVLDGPRPLSRRELRVLDAAYRRNAVRAALWAVLALPILASAVGTLVLVLSGLVAL